MPAKLKLSLDFQYEPTFANLDKPYPGQIFTEVIWGNKRSKFGSPEYDYKEKLICVTGKIAETREVHETIATNRVVAWSKLECRPTPIKNLSNSFPRAFIVIL